MIAIIMSVMTNMNGTLRTWTIDRSHLLLDVFSVYGFLHYNTHSFSFKNKGYFSGVSLHDEHSVGSSPVQVAQIGLQAGHSFFAVSGKVLA